MEGKLLRKQALRLVVKKFVSTYQLTVVTQRTTIKAP